MKVSLKAKTFIMIFIITAVLCAASIIGTNIALTNIIRQQFIDKAESLTNAMANLMDKDAAAKVRDEVIVEKSIYRSMGFEETGLFENRMEELRLKC